MPAASGSTYSDKSASEVNFAELHWNRGKCRKGIMHMPAEVTAAEFQRNRGLESFLANSNAAQSRKNRQGVLLGPWLLWLPAAEKSEGKHDQG